MQITSYKHHLNLVLTLPSEKTAIIVCQSILPEYSAKHNKRSKNTVNINKNLLSFTFNAQDLTALKASVNTILRLLGVSLNTLKIVKPVD